MLLNLYRQDYYGSSIIIGEFQYITFTFYLFCGARSTILEVRLDTFFYFGCKWGAFIKVVDKKDHFNSKSLIYKGLNLEKKGRE